jgi:hypothetical protein
MFIIRAPMNVVEEKELWTNGHDCFGFLVQCTKECVENKLIRFDNPMISVLSIWSMGHGLVALDLRCRFKVMEMDEEAVKAIIEKSIREYHQLIKN